MQLTPSADGCLLNVKVVPGASRTAIAGEYGDGIKVTVAAAPQRGAANEAVIELLSAALSLPRSGVQVVRGHTSPRKVVLIVGRTAAEIEQRLGAR